MSFTIYNFIFKWDIGESEQRRTETKRHNGRSMGILSMLLHWHYQIPQSRCDPGIHWNGNIVIFTTWLPWCQLKCLNFLQVFTFNISGHYEYSSGQCRDDVASACCLANDSNYMCKPCLVYAMSSPVTGFHDGFVSSVSYTTFYGQWYPLLSLSVSQRVLCSMKHTVFS